MIDIDTNNMRTQGPNAPQPGAQLASILTEFSRIGKQQPLSRECLLTETAEVLLAGTSAKFVFRLVLDSDISDHSNLDTIATDYPSVPQNTQLWATNIGMKSCLSDELQVDSVTDSNANRIQMIAVPVNTNGVSDTRYESIVVLFAPCSGNATFELMCAQAIADCMAQFDSNLKLTETIQLATELAAVSELVSRIENSDAPQSACQRLANELAGHFTRLDTGESPKPCENSSPDEFAVYVALAHEDGQISLTAISNTHSVPTESRLVEFVESAMRESVCRNSLSAWPTRGQHAMLCHRQLARHADQSNLVSTPLHDAAGKLQGAILIASAKTLPPAITIFLKCCERPVASSLGLLKKAQHNKVQRLVERSVEAWQSGKIKTLGKIGIGLICLSLIPIPYRVACDCQIQPSIKRYVAAPFAGLLEACTVEPGDKVTQGQIVARIDGREIKMELAEVEADLHRAMKLLDGHVALHESGEARVAKFETQRLRARRDLLSYQNDNLVLRSPVQGIVITGDLIKAEGMPLETGQALFEIAPLDNLLVEVSVPDDDVRYVQPGMQVRVALDGFPFRSWQGTIERLNPASELRDENNVFVATVKLANESGELRPGMKGIARIKTVWRPICWNYMHQPVARGLRWLGW